MCVCLCVCQGQGRVGLEALSQAGRACKSSMVGMHPSGWHVVELLCVVLHTGTQKALQQQGIRIRVVLNMQSANSVRMAQTRPYTNTPATL